MNQHDMTEQAYKNGYEKGKADAMKSIVRCKDCKHYSMLKMHCNHPNDSYIEMEADDFCSYGERRIDHATN